MTKRPAAAALLLTLGCAGPPAPESTEAAVPAVGEGGFRFVDIGNGHDFSVVHVAVLADMAFANLTDADHGDSDGFG